MRCWGAWFDGVDAAAWLNYDLTTVLQPLERMVEAAVEIFGAY